MQGLNVALTQHNKRTSTRLCTPCMIVFAIPNDVGPTPVLSLAFAMEDQHEERTASSSAFSSHVCATAMVAT